MNYITCKRKRKKSESDVFSEEAPTAKETTEIRAYLIGRKFLLFWFKNAQLHLWQAFCTCCKEIAAYENLNSLSQTIIPKSAAEALAGQL